VRAVAVSTLNSRLSTLSPYLAVVSARFRMTLQYRAAALAGMSVQLFWGFILVMLFTAFYHSTTAPQPMTLPQVVTYIWLGQALLAFLPWDSDPDVRIMVRSGTLVYELLRPLDLQALWFWRAVAYRVARAALRAVPMFVIAVLLLGMQPPASWAAAGAWLLATVGAVLLSCAFTGILTISLLWTISGEGLQQLTVAAVLLFSGALVPLPFFPDWAQRILDFLPFRGLIDIPFRLYLGHLPAGHVFALFASQLAWTIAMLAVGRALIALGTRRMVLQGG
jgi:ABC-2 type transport system permease protein